MGQPNTGRSWWRGVTECGPLQKGMANHFSILAVRTPWTEWKDKKIQHWMMSPPAPRSQDVQYVTGEEQRAITNSYRKNEEVRPKQKWHSVANISGGESKVWSCKEQYCIGTWNVRSMNQGKLDKVKQEKARVNIDILGINELKWTVMSESNSDDHYI